MALLYVAHARDRANFLVSPVVVVKYGYFADEQVDKKIKGIKPRASVVMKTTERPKRSVNQVSLGFHDPMISLPVPARNDPYSQLLGVCKRIIPELPIPFDLRNELFCFADAFFALYFRPLVDSELMTPEEWLASCSFPQTRKKQYLERWVESNYGQNLDFRSKGFEKEETYTDFKFPRNIQPLDLAVNMVKGPIDKAIEKQVFALPCFIKKVPEPLRAEHLATQVCGLSMMVTYTDYTSMEAQYEGVKYEVQERLEAKWVHALSGGERYLEIGRRTTAVWAGRAQSIEMPTLTVKNAENLRSGDTATSRKNAVQNATNRYFLLQRFFGINCLREDVTYTTPMFDRVCSDAGVVAGNFGPLGVMEGDDGFYAEERWAQLTTHHYASIGYVCEPQHGMLGQDGDFLSVFFDEQDMEMLTDVRSVYADLGWGGSDYITASNARKRELARAKALSNLYRLPGCPVVTAQALHVIRCTADVDLQGFFRRKHPSISGWELEQMHTAYIEHRHGRVFAHRIGDRSRLLIEKYCGITVDEQLRIEQVFNESNELKPRSLMPADKCPAAWVTNSFEYVRGVQLVDLREHKDVPPEVPSKFDNFSRDFWAKHGDQISDRRGRIGADVFT